MLQVSLPAMGLNQQAANSQPYEFPICPTIASILKQLKDSFSMPNKYAAEYSTLLVQSSKHLLFMQNTTYVRIAIC